VKNVHLFGELLSLTAENDSQFRLIQSKASGNPFLAGGFFDAQAKDCPGDYQLLNL